MVGGITAADNGTSSGISGGGTYYSGVTQVTLSPLASSTNNFYTGSTISIVSNNGSTNTQSTKFNNNYLKLFPTALGIHEDKEMSDKIYPIAKNILDDKAKIDVKTVRKIFI